MAKISPSLFFGGILVLWLAVLAAYSNSFNIAFQFDDTHTAQSNMFIRSFKNVPRFFIDAKTSSYRPENSGYRPMTTLALTLGFALSQTQTWGYHFVKLIEHCLVSLLILLIGLRILPHSGALSKTIFFGKIDGRFLACFFAALIFGVHRANTETVDYITAVSTLQAGLFYLLAFFLFLKWRQDESPPKKRWTYYGLSLVCYMAGMMSKEEAVTLPAMVFLYMWIFDARPLIESLRSSFWKWTKLTLPYLVTGLIFVILRTVIQPSDADLSRGNISVFVYGITQIRSWLYYIKLFFWPVVLNADNLGFEFSQGLDDSRIWGALFVHASIWFIAWRLSKKFRFALYIVAWIYITVLPASSIFVLVEAVNEHRMYLPFVGWALFTSWLFFEGASRSKAKYANVFSVGLVSSLCLLLGVGTYARNQVWQTPISLWEDVLSKNPESPRAMNILGVALLNNNEFERGLPILEKCHQIANHYLPCMVHLSIAYAHYRQFDKGLQVLQKGNAIDPWYPHINYHLGSYYKDYYGDFENARKHLQRVVERTQGRMFQAALKLAEMDFEEGKFETGFQAVGSVLSIDNSNAEAWEVYAKGYLKMGQYDHAQGVFLRLYEAAPMSARYLLCLANLYERKGELPSAKAFYDRTVNAAPNMIQGWQGFSRVAKLLKDTALQKTADDRVSALLKSNDYQFLTSMFMLGEKPRQIKPL